MKCMLLAGSELNTASTRRRLLEDSSLCQRIKGGCTKAQARPPKIDCSVDAGVLKNFKTGAQFAKDCVGPLQKISVQIATKFGFSDLIPFKSCFVSIFKASYCVTESVCIAISNDYLAVPG